MGIREEKIKNALACLLHDIGKFYQRTGRRIEDNYYESFMKKNSYRHAAYTAQFIDKYISKQFKELINLSARHHTEVSGDVKKADSFASGHDRRSEEEVDLLSEKEETENNYIISRMNSIFDIILEGYKNKKTYVNLSRLSNYDNSEKPNFSKLEDCKKEYDKLFEEFSYRVSELKYQSYEELYQLLYPLIKEYTCTIPSSTYNISIPTVSLFDHLKLTTAIGNCLKGNYDEKGKTLLIVEYDLSGIQKFIFQITEGTETKDKVSKSLRTRSLYLNMLCDFIACSILNEFDLTYDNILYSSGGKGQVLLTNTEDTKEKLKKLTNRIVKSIYKNHGTDLFFAFTSREISIDDLIKANFRDLMHYESESKEVLTSKKQRYNSLFKDDDFTFVEDKNTKPCILCSSTNDSNSDTCTLCRKLLKLNDDILAKSNQFVVEFSFNQTKKEDAISFNFDDLGTINYYKKFNGKINQGSYYYSINNSEIGEIKYYAQSNISGISFEEIGQKAVDEDYRGDVKVAIVKMDVDNLGYIFGKGFEQPTISKILTLSRNMDYFFSKKMVDLCNKTAKDNPIYIIYSGGDDLAAVMPAAYSLEFIDNLNKEFNQYVGHNKEIHLSSGIEIFNPKAPVRFAIKRAEESLSKAKDVEGKNSVGVLDCVLPNSKLSAINSEISKYSEALNNDKLSRTTIYNLYLSIKVCLEHKQPIEAFKRYIPKIAYSISRNVTGEWLNVLKNLFVRDNVTKEMLEDYKIIYSYALMTTRRKKSESR
jgi:CRISPR-associated protein Csm1